MRIRSRQLSSGLTVFGVVGLGLAGFSTSAWAAVCNVPDMTHATIQSAADDPNCTQIILAAQTFTEQVTIGRAGSITLQGAGAGRTIIQSPAVRVPSTLPTTYYPNYTYIVQVPPGLAANISGLTIDGTSNSYCGEPLFGVRFNNASGSLEQVVVQNVRSPDADFGCQNTVAVAGTADGGGSSSLTVDRSTVRNFQKVGILVNGSGAGGIITNNIIHGVGPTTLTAQNGIQVSRGAIGTVSTNSIDGIQFTGDTCLGGGTSQGSGILVYQAGDLFVTQNTLINLDRGIWLQANTGPVTVYQNRVYTSYNGISTLGNTSGAVRISANSVTQTTISPAVNAATCFADSGDAISIGAETGTVVIQNAAADSARDAIELLTGAQSLDVEQNKSVRSTRADIEDEGTGDSITLNACTTSLPTGLCALSP